MRKITLYVYVTSPYANKVKCFLDYKGLDYDVVHVDPLKREEVAFTSQRQIPVLQIDDEWRVDSTPIGLWLDEIFPEKKLVPDGFSKDKIVQLDNWVSQVLIASIFRQVADWNSLLAGLQDGWALSSTLNKSKTLSFFARVCWPIGLKYTGFINRIADQLNRNEPIEDMRKRVLDEFLEQLSDGPYLGSLNVPTLADFAAYPQLAFPFALNMNQALPIHDYPKILDWMARIHSYLPDNPLLMHSSCIVNKLRELKKI